MNSREFKCVDCLKDMVENDGVIGIKTSFEDEGALFNETIRLKQVCNEADIKLTLKIGGPEAIRDIKDSTIIGVKGIVAPMVESAFALNKFIKAAQNNIPNDTLSTIYLNVNIETKTAVQNIDEMSKTDSIKFLNGITVGRVDLVSSMGKDRSYVDSDEVYEMTKKVFKIAKQYGLKACLGGAISIKSLNFLKSLYSEGLLDKFETRYVIYDPSISLKNFSRALSKGQIFEYEWLSAKKEYYNALAAQDEKRIQMIQERINNSISYK
jgi:hypothetical protein